MVAAVVGIAALVGIASARLNPPHASALQPQLWSAPETPATPRWKDATPYRPIVSHLFALRAQAFATGHLSLLDSIYAPNSFVHDMDDASLRIMRTQQVRTRGFVQHIVKMTVLDVSVGHLELDVTTTIEPYTVVDAAGRVVARRAARTQHFGMILDRRHGVWLIQGLGRAPVVAGPP
jgi:hypothetical protein